MNLTPQELETVKGIVTQKPIMAIIEKFFIREFENLPPEYQNVPNESLGEIVKAQLSARALNRRYLTELKMAVGDDKKAVSPVAPD